VLHAYYPIEPTIEMRIKMRIDLSGQRISAPAAMPVRSYQHEAAFVGRACPCVFDPMHCKRYSALLRARFDRRYACLVHGTGAEVEKQAGDNQTRDDRNSDGAIEGSI